MDPPFVVGILSATFASPSFRNHSKISCRAVHALSVDIYLVAIGLRYVHIFSDAMGSDIMVSTRTTGAHYSSIPRQACLIENLTLEANQLDSVISDLRNVR